MRVSPGDHIARGLGMVALLLIVSTTAHSAPFLVADVPDGADTCTVAGLPVAVVASVPSKPGTPATCAWDLAPLPTGNYTVTARVFSALWGAGSVASTPFSFTRPAPLPAPTGLRVAP